MLTEHKGIKHQTHYSLYAPFTLTTICFDQSLTLILGNLSFFNQLHVIPEINMSKNIHYTVVQSGYLLKHASESFKGEAPAFDEYQQFPR